VRGHQDLVSSIRTGQDNLRVCGHREPARIMRRLYICWSRSRLQRDRGSRSGLREFYHLGFAIMIGVHLPFESFVAVSSGRLCCAIMYARVRADQQLVLTKERPFLETDYRPTVMTTFLLAILRRDTTTDFLLGYMVRISLV
jgi:hypothetical protein